MLNQKDLPDGNPTISEWPVRIWKREEIPSQYETAIGMWLDTPFSDYDFVHAPKRRTNAASFDYLFGYGNDRIVFIRELPDSEAEFVSKAVLPQPVEIQKRQVTAVCTERELLNAKIILHYRDKGGEKKLEFPYIPSVYYLYDPFLNWLLGLDREFVPAIAEREHPRPLSLYNQSLAMYNYSLNAYRLGSGFEKYQYESKQHRCKWMPWKKTLEEWLKVSMERGRFELHSFGYLTECGYWIAG